MSTGVPTGSGASRVTTTGVGSAAHAVAVMSGFVAVE
jgi:hypothetical protein